MFNESHPEYQINNWDCGFYQIKALLKEFMPDDLKEFRALYKQLAETDPTMKDLLAQLEALGGSLDVEDLTTQADLY